ncbi:FAD-dependent oxidoreductase [soil metagenome]
MPTRRHFLGSASLAAASHLYPLCSMAAPGAPTGGPDFDIVIVGGSLGGCAAALAATRHGHRVLLAEPTDWIGGQLTQQGVPPDEHQWIESHGATASYRQFRSKIRDHYRNHYPLTDAARDNPLLNPGNGSVSRLCHEPRAALAALDALLAPAVSSGCLQILLGTTLTGADTDGDRVRAATLRTADGREITTTARYFIDATEHGDLLPLTGTEFVTGAESQRDTDEPHAPAEADPHNVQAPTWCFAIDHLPGENHTIDRPADYAFWRDFVPDLDPPWSGRLLSLHYSNPRTLEPKALAFVPPTGTDPPPTTDALNLWLYRRILDPNNFANGSYRSGITVVNWPQNDYLLGNLITGTQEENARHLRGARELSLSLLYWLQTEAPRPDGGTGWPGLRLRGDVMGNAPHGLAKSPYIRESRRIRAEFTILEQHITRTGDRTRATPFPDSVGVGSYHLDLHPSSGGDNYIDTASLPFQIPLGALIPMRMENLLPACKNIGTTHISNGCYRLHPVEWNIGESAGALAAHCLTTAHSPRATRNSPDLLADFQSSLRSQGVELEWPA